MANYITSDDPDFYQKRTKSLLQTDYPLSVLDIDFTKADPASIHWHQHEEIEFIYILTGQAYITCEQDTFLAGENDIIFINQNTRHFITPTKGCFFRSIIFHPSLIFGLGQIEMEQKYITPVLHDISLKKLYITKDNIYYSAFRTHVETIIMLNTEESVAYELLTKASLLYLWTKLYDLSVRDSALPVKKTAVLDEQRVKQAILYIQEHYMEAITLDDIAASILVSKSECCRCFKRTLNLTPFEYLMKYRILASTKKIHSKTNESISEIAGSVGFNNASYYNKIFKKYMHCTPTEYRNSIKKDIPPIE